MLLPSARLLVKWLDDDAVEMLGAESHHRARPPLSMRRNAIYEGFCAGILSLRSCRGADVGRRDAAMTPAQLAKLIL